MTAGRAPAIIAAMRPFHPVLGDGKSPFKKELAKNLRRHMTPEETLHWNRLRRSQLGGLHFRRQQLIEGYVADFYCHSARLVVEAYGGVHASQRGYDEYRDAVMRRNGLRVLRVTNDEIRRDVEAVLTRILNAARLAPIPLPPSHGEGGSFLRARPKT